jgi:WD40 repeat protein
VAFSPDGKRIVSGSDDSTLKVWDTDKGQEVRSLRGHAGLVTCVAFSPDGKHLVSRGYDSTLKVWDAEKGQELLSLKGHTGAVLCVAFSPDGKRIVSGSYDGTLKVWKADKGQEVLSLNGQKGGVLCPDGKRVVNGSHELVEGGCGEVFTTKLPWEPVLRSDVAMTTPSTTHKARWGGVQGGPAGPAHLTEDHLSWCFHQLGSVPDINWQSDLPGRNCF